MLKKISRLLLLGIVVCAGSAYVTPTYASSATLLPSPTAGVIITHIYPGTPQGATHELIAIFNNTDAPIDITGWCLMNGVVRSVYCFNGQDRARYWIEPGTSVVVASEEYASTQQQEQVDVSYTVSNRNSGSLVGSGDAVLLLDAQGRVVDERAWTSALQKGFGLIRAMFDGEVGRYSKDSSLVEQPIVSVTGGGLRLHEADQVDETPEVEEDAMPFGLRLSEILPNPTGVDTGAEFVEIYNPESTPISLEGYRLLITAGVSHKAYPFPAGSIINPGEYRAFSDKEMKYTLNNSAGVIILTAIQVGVSADVEVDGAAYENPKDGAAWAWFPDSPLGPGWQYTDSPTPGAANIAPVMLELPSPDPLERKPCDIGQYRNPQTGRCKKVESLAAPAACKQTQYRNPETGRCKNTSSAKEPSACKEGQERNLQTNRCRNIKVMTRADHAPLPKVEERRGDVAWYTWLAVAAVGVGAVTYGVWEWRQEIREVWQRVRRK